MTQSEGGWRLIGDLYNLIEVPGVALNDNDAPEVRLDPIAALRKRVSKLGAQWRDYIRKLSAQELYVDPVPLAEEKLHNTLPKPGSNEIWEQLVSAGLTARFWRFSLPASWPRRTALTIEATGAGGEKLPERITALYRGLSSQGSAGASLGEGKLQITESNAKEAGSGVLAAVVDTWAGAPEPVAATITVTVTALPGPADPTKFLLNFRVPFRCAGSSQVRSAASLVYNSYASSANRAQVAWRDAGSFSVSGVKTTASTSLLSPGPAKRDTFDVVGTIDFDPAPATLRTTRTKLTSEDVPTGDRSVIDFTLQKIPCEISSSRVSCNLDERSLRANPQSYVGSFTWEIFDRAGTKKFGCAPEWAAPVWDSAHPKSIIQVLIE